MRTSRVRARSRRAPGGNPNEATGHTTKPPARFGEPTQLGVGALVYGGYCSVCHGPAVVAPHLEPVLGSRLAVEDVQLDPLLEGAQPLGGGVGLGPDVGGSGMSGSLEFKLADPGNSAVSTYIFRGSRDGVANDDPAGLLPHAANNSPITRIKKNCFIISPSLAFP